jgi:hypothetical protein
MQDEHRFRHSQETKEWVDSKLKNKGYKHIVYPGLCPKRVFRARDIFWWFKYLNGWGPKYEDIIIVEVDDGMYKGLVEENEFNIIVKANVVNYEPPENSLLFYSHGVEHLPEWKFKYKAFPFWSRVYKGIALFAPWGRWDQPAGGNLFEEHKWQVYEPDFKMLGLDTFTYGPKDKFGEIVGIKTFKE